jgi:hypothetical protein
MFVEQSQEYKFKYEKNIYQQRPIFYAMKQFSIKCGRAQVCSLTTMELK